MGSKTGYSRSRRIVFVADELLGYARQRYGHLDDLRVPRACANGAQCRGHLRRADAVGPVDPEWQRLYDEAGVRIRRVPQGEQRVEPRYFARARDVEAVLRADPPDIVVVQDLGAPAYTAIRLRRLGLAFERHAVRRLLPWHETVDHRRQPQGARAARSSRDRVCSSAHRSSSRTPSSARAPTSSTGCGARAGSFRNRRS